jgi:hypothetical protein
MLIFANVLPKPKSFMATTLISPEIITLQTFEVYENEKYHIHHISSCHRSYGSVGTNIFA